jgi:2-polyprenyl-3-methyl-5-hydroxy-6-metoxy-1,4-benzoquinol methylase
VTLGSVTEYGFDPSWSDERRRLELIERCYDPATTSRLDQLGVRPGWRCLDVGAGGGSIARWLRDRVGAAGSVVAVDLDTRFFENEPGIESRQLDVLTDDVEHVEYDLVHCRLLLHHLRGSQLDALRRMAGALRPNGLLLVSEPYLGAMLSSSSEPCAAMWRGFHAAMPNADYAWAPGLPATMQATGLTGVEACGTVDILRGGTQEAELLALTVEAVRPRIPADASIDAGIERLRDPTAFEPGIVWYSAWGRRGQA